MLEPLRLEFGKMQNQSRNKAAEKKEIEAKDGPREVKHLKWDSVAD